MDDLPGPDDLESDHAHAAAGLGSIYDHKAGFTLGAGAGMMKGGPYQGAKQGISTALGSLAGEQAMGSAAKIMGHDNNIVGRGMKALGRGFGGAAGSSFSQSDTLDEYTDQDSDEESG